MINISIFNTFIFVIWLFLIWKFKKNNYALKFISIEFLFSAITGIYFIQYGEREYYNLTFYGSLIFFIFFFISVLPLFKTEIKSTQNIYINEKSIKILCTIFFWGSILPFINSIISLKFLLGGDIATLMKEFHDSRFYGTNQNSFNIISFFIDLSIKAAYYTKAFLPLFVIYLYNKYEKINKYIWGIFLTQITLVLSSLITSSRFLVVDFTLTYLFTYCLLYNKLKDTTKLFFKKLFKYGGCIIFIILFIITIGRAIAMGYTDITSILAWISLYTGEGMLNFNEFTIHDTIRFGIEGVFPTLLNEKDYQQFLQYNADDYAKEWGWILGHEANTFKSVYGDFVGSFGIGNSIIIFLIISFIIIFFSKKLIQSFSGIALLITIFKYIYFGFLYFPYSGINGNNYLYQALLSIIIIRAFEIYGKKTTL